VESKIKYGTITVSSKILKPGKGGNEKGEHKEVYNNYIASATENKTILSVGKKSRDSILCARSAGNSRGEAYLTWNGGISRPALRLLSFGN